MMPRPMQQVADLVAIYHNLSPEKRDNNYTPHPLTPTSCLRIKFNLWLASVPVLGVCNVHFNKLQYYR